MSRPSPRKGPDKAYQRALMRRKYWRGPGTSMKWKIVRRVVHADELILICRADGYPKEIGVFMFMWSILRRNHIPSDKFYYSGSERYVDRLLEDFKKLAEEYQKQRSTRAAHS